MTFMKWGSVWLANRRKQYASVPVTYVRGDTSYPDIFAGFGVTSYESRQEKRFASVNDRLRDFIISRDDLPVETPKLGDKIVWDGVRYDLVNSQALHAGREQTGSCWAWTDGTKTSVRVHTRKIGAE